MKTTLMAKLIGIAALSALAATAFAQDQVNVRFSWKMKGEYGPLFMAQEKGLYAKEKLSVRMGEGAGAQAALGALLQGQEDVVILPAIFALTAIQKGMPVKLIAIYHPRTPLGIISFPDKPVRTPKDLEGKTIAHSVGETGTSYLDAFCKINSVDCSKISKVQMNSQARMPQFLQRQVDLVTVYTNVDLPLIEQQTKQTFVMLDMPKFGFAIPGLAVVTSDANIAGRADVLKRYLRATAEGIAEAKKNNDEATKAMLKNWSGAPDPAIVSAQVRLTGEAIPIPQGHMIGWIDDKLITDTLDLLKSAGEIEAPKPPGSYYTNSLLGG
ncbi:MAG: ABC transporter substrate-binding protein [Betaproteobacteria bacterium]